MDNSDSNKKGQKVKNFSNNNLCYKNENGDLCKKKNKI